VKWLGDDEKKLGKNFTDLVGSVSFTYSQLVNAGKGKFWATIFDDLNDDHYDGDFKVDDEETPRILIEFTTVGQPSKRASVAKPIEKKLTAPAARK
jgi:hypothetical protein